MTHGRRREADHNGGRKRERGDARREERMDHETDRDMRDQVLPTATVAQDVSRENQEEQACMDSVRNPRCHQWSRNRDSTLE
jgi:hypothetical protein